MRNFNFKLENKIGFSLRKKWWHFISFNCELYLKSKKLFHNVHFLIVNLRNFVIINFHDRQSEHWLCHHYGKTSYQVKLLTYCCITNPHILHPPEHEAWHGGQHQTGTEVSSAARGRGGRGDWLLGRGGFGASFV